MTNIKTRDRVIKIIYKTNIIITTWWLELILKQEGILFNFFK